jgi:hypothetical protein
MQKSSFKSVFIILFGVHSEMHVVNMALGNFFFFLSCVIKKMSYTPAEKDKTDQP